MPEPPKTAWWGKAGLGGDCHPLIWHSLDVAAVARAYLEHQTALRQHLASHLHISEQQLIDWVVFFAAIHDIGKYSGAFQQLCGELFTERLPAQAAAPVETGTQHDQLGFGIWRNCLKQPMMRAGLWSLNGWKERQQFNYLNHWALVATGHHGQPPDDGIVALTTDLVDDSTRLALFEFAEAVREQVLTHPVLKGPELGPEEASDALKRCSWLLSGVLTFADWIGSNRVWFSYHDKDGEIDDYWNRALKRARVVLAESGLLPARSRDVYRLDDLFPASAYNELTPMQALAESMPLDSGPQLIICEDVLNGGKTEAALMLAHRLKHKLGAPGIYYAVPTMATANALFEYACSVHANGFESPEDASLVFAHTGRNLDPCMQRFVDYTVQASVTSMPLPWNERATAEASCAAWFADSAKRALFADLGVGTIDQALQAIMKNHHQSLRLLGLFGKVLVIDEVHTNDAFMRRLLKLLLRVHASHGGSAILMSSSLPSWYRDELFDTYNATQAAPVENAFPVLSQATLNGEVKSRAVAPPFWARRQVEPHYTDHINSVLAHIDESVKNQRCLVWIRNSVADARDAYALLKERYHSADVTLFHSRFVMGERNALEQEILQRFGPKSTADQRRSRILVCTPVVESCVDLDFDDMVSDLAPMELLIQRSGRLQRHWRTPAGDRNEAGDQRGTAKFLVYGPMPHDKANPDWFVENWPHTASIHEDQAILWLTVREVVRSKTWQFPDDTRVLINRVYGEGSTANAPEAIQRTHTDYIDRCASDVSAEGSRLIKPDMGYRLLGPIWASVHTPKNLGEATQTVYLAVRGSDGVPKPLCPLYTRHTWQQSRLKIPLRLVAQGASQEDIDAIRNQLPGQGIWCQLLVMEEQDNGLYSCEALDIDGRSRLIRYSSEHGLIFDDEDV